MTIPTTDRTQIPISSSGMETHPASVSVKGSLWTLFVRYGALYIREYEGVTYRRIRTQVRDFCLTNALNDTGSYESDKFWVWEISDYRGLKLLEYEPFSDVSPTLLFEHILKTNIVQCYPYVTENNPVRLFTLHNTTPKEFKYSIYSDIKSGVPTSVDDLYWDDTRGDDFSSFVAALNQPLYNVYSGTASPPNIYIEEYVSPVVADFSGTPTSGPPPLTVNFTDLSTGYITTWFWDFGDTGTSALQNPTHIYTSPGTYTVSLTASGPGSSDTVTKPNYITVSAPAPMADFTATPTSGFFPKVQFTDTSTSYGTITEWSWDFGDGYTSTEQNPSHRYNVAGVYTVSLTVKDNYGGQDTKTQTDYIESKEFLIDVDFEGDPQEGESPLTVQFTDMSEIPQGYTVASYEWGFGDTEESSEKNPEHLYIQNGRFTVTLTLRVDI